MTLQLLLSGTELMMGDIVDTNSAYIASKLDNLGLSIDKKVTVGDDLNALVKEIRNATFSSEVLIINGGLGPTSDDLTAEALAIAANTSLSLNLEALSHLQQWCNKRQIDLTDANRKQVFLPNGCQIIPNDIGSAVGFSLTLNGCKVFCTPGVPSELHLMMKHISKALEQCERIRSAKSIERYHVFGLGESQLQQRINDELPALPANVTLGFRAAKPYLEIKLSYDSKIADADIAHWRDHLLALLGSNRFENGDNLQESLQHELLANNKRITTVESCTGGLIASMLTETAGSSAVFEAGFVTYSNAMKTTLVNVSPETLAAHGAVSREVVTEMAYGGLAVSGADYVIAVSGVAGPSGGSPEKPVGTVWIAWGSKKCLKVEGLQLNGDRKTFQTMVAAIGLDLIRRELLKIEAIPDYITSRKIRVKYKN